MTTTTMLDTAQAIEQRRSVKHYDPSFKIPDADIRKLLELTLLSPTSFNIQNWRFVVVDKPEVKQQLREASWNQAQVTDASHVVAVCANLLAAEENPARYWVNAPQATQDFLVPMISKFYVNNPELQRDEAMRSCGIAGQTLMLAAKAMGYDTCPMVGFDPAKVAEIIQLPANHIITMLIVVGKALQPAHPRGGQLPYEEVVLQNQF